MKKSVLFFAVSTFIAGVIFTSCNTPKQKVENAQNNVTEANKDLDKANQEYLVEIENYRKETADKIAANDQSIVEFKARVEHDKKEAKADKDYLKDAWAAWAKKYHAELDRWFNDVKAHFKELKEKVTGANASLMSKEEAEGLEKLLADSMAKVEKNISLSKSLPVDVDPELLKKARTVILQGTRDLQTSLKTLAADAEKEIKAALGKIPKSDKGAETENAGAKKKSTEEGRGTLGRSALETSDVETGTEGRRSALGRSALGTRGLSEAPRSRDLGGTSKRQATESF